MKTRLAVMSLAVIALSACMGVVQGNGVRREEERTVGEFESLKIGDGFHATAVVGSRASLRIEADENLLPYIGARVENGTLVIDSGDAQLLSSAPTRISIVTPQLTAARVFGTTTLVAEATPTDVLVAEASHGARLTITRVEAGRVVGVGSGGSRLHLAGVVKAASLYCSGGSRAETDGLSAELVSLEGSGAAMGTVRASEVVAGALSGGSSFVVLGRPSTVLLQTSGGSSFQLGE